MYAKFNLPIELCNFVHHGFLDLLRYTNYIPYIHVLLYFMRRVYKTNKEINFRNPKEQANNDTKDFLIVTLIH